MRSFANGHAGAGDGGIDALVLNAGGQRPDVAARSAEGYELTFATNHLAHYLLLRLLAPRFNPGARVVITSSGTHDPAEKTGVPPPRHADALRLAHPDRDPQLSANPVTAGMRAYSTSKLANLMTALAFAGDRRRRAKRLIVTAYDPGLTPGHRAGARPDVGGADAGLAAAAAGAAVPQRHEQPGGRRAAASPIWRRPKCRRRAASMPRCARAG